MRLLIDMQSAQSGSRKRGLGRYTTALTKALVPVTKAAGHELHLLANSAFHGTVPALQRDFPDLHNLGRLHVFGGLDAKPPENRAWRRAANGHLWDMAVAAIAPDVVFRPSHFEGENESFAHPTARIPPAPIVAALHDFIPLLMREIFLDPNPDFASFYKDRLDALAYCNAFVAISKSAAAEARDVGGIPEDKITVVYEDAGPEFNANAVDLLKTDGMRRRMGLDRSYILYAGSGEPRKNVARLIAAYAGLPQQLRRTNDLVIAGQLTEIEHANFTQQANDSLQDEGRVKLLGYMQDREMPGLFAAADLFVMPSVHEGFGLPALEAIRCSTATLVAKRTSLPEIVGVEDAFFDPEDVSELTAKMAYFLSDPRAVSELLTAEQAYTSRFSWQHAAEATLNVLENSAEMAPEPAPAYWHGVQNKLDHLERSVTQALSALPNPKTGDREAAARAVLRTRRMGAAAHRPRNWRTALPRWRLEGPLASNYSLAAVNRHTAHALKRAGATVTLTSADGPGPLPLSAEDRSQIPDLVPLLVSADAQDPADVVSRNMFPPRAWDMEATMGLLHGYAWEETGLPPDYVRDWRAHLQGCLVTAPHVKKLMIDQGLDIPVHVVGNGVDHLTKAAAGLPVTLPNAAFTLLHVSSCFPRKGPDLVLDAFATAFSGMTDVALVIKTHPNDHNVLASQITDLQTRFPNLPPITVIDTSLSPAEMRALYTAADLLLAPSRAEGFCLPVAEAILAGTRVLTTGWGGQMLFAANPLVTLIDYDFVPAQSHLDTWDSVWAEPRLQDMVKKLKALRVAPKPSVDTVKAAKVDLLARHTWDQVAARSLEAARDILQSSPAPPPRIAWISSYNTRCGIATYSAHLLAAFPDDVQMLAARTDDRPKPDPADLIRCWRADGRDNLDELSAALDGTEAQAVVIQFNYAFFDPAELGRLISAQKKVGRLVIMMLHSTEDAAVPVDRRLARLGDALQLCDRLLVHSVSDLNRLKAMGLVENVALFPHGVPLVESAPPRHILPEQPIVLGSFGFFLPQKGFDRLIAAVGQLRAEGYDVTLDLITAEYPNPISAKAIAAARRQITELDLDHHVTLITDFLDDAESLARLARADILVFPYGPSTESASGAVRQALALDRPVAVTPGPIFDDVDALVLKLPGHDVEALCIGLKDLVTTLRSGDPEGRLAKRQATAARWRDVHAYRVLSDRLWRQICALWWDSAPDALHMDLS
ncbi:MAG: glycosyltransferase [Pseudomonadota bacterium]